MVGAGPYNKTVDNQNRKKKSLSTRFVKYIGVEVEVRFSHDARALVRRGDSGSQTVSDDGKKHGSQCSRFESARAAGLIEQLQSLV